MNTNGHEWLRKWGGVWAGGLCLACAEPRGEPLKEPGDPISDIRVHSRSFVVQPKRRDHE